MIISIICKIQSIVRIINCMIQLDANGFIWLKSRISDTLLSDRIKMPFILEILYRFSSFQVKYFVCDRVAFQLFILCQTTSKFGVFKQHWFFLVVLQWFFLSHMGWLGSLMPPYSAESLVGTPWFVTWPFFSRIASTSLQMAVRLLRGSELIYKSLLVSCLQRFHWSRQIHGQAHMGGNFNWVWILGGVVNWGLSVYLPKAATSLLISLVLYPFSLVVKVLIFNMMHGHLE